MGLQRNEVLTIAISIIATGIICGFMAFNYYGNKLPELKQSNNEIATRHEEYSQYQLEGQTKLDELAQKITNSLPTEISCWGDDLTAGVGGGDVTYPNVLKSLLLNNVYLEDTSKLCPSVKNFGITGESSVTVFGRWGLIPYITTKIIDIPKDTTPVPIYFISSRFDYAKPLLNGKTGFEYVTINGIKGYITLEDNQYYFTRAEEGNPTTINSGTEIVTSAYESTQGDLPIISVGQNGGYTSVADLISQYKKVVQDCGSDKYLTLGLITGTKQSQEEFESSMTSTFGDNFINLREYLSTDALKDAEIEPTQEDLNAMSIGSVPPSLLSDNTHLNSMGYELVAKCIYSRMVDLGYFKDISNYVEEYLKIIEEYNL
ncbi:MAG: hypothetical protein ACI4WH_02040 [Oscillospiraceae bacterium]